MLSSSLCLCLLCYPTCRTIVQFSSVAQLCPALCDPMDCSTPGFPDHHQLPEPAQTHIHQVGDAVQPSHPLSSSSPPAFNLSQHQGLVQWVSSLRQVAKLLEFGLQHHSFQWISGLISFETDLISLQSKGLSRVFSSTTIQKHEFSTFVMVQLSHPYMTTGKL